MKILWHEAWGYSTWVRLYASYLEERLECFRVLKYDVQKDHSVRSLNWNLCASSSYV